MGRPLRQSWGGVVYHVLNRRVLRLEWFEDRGDPPALPRVLALADPEAGKQRGDLSFP